MAPPATRCSTRRPQFNPITAYGRVQGSRRSRTSPKLADDNFSPTFLRNATAYGASPRLRADIVVNNLVGVAYTTGEVLIQSDGTPWRPLVHIQDISRAFLAVLEAPREASHNQAFNVGSSQENYQIRDIADDGAGSRAGLHGEVHGRRRAGSALLPVNCDKLTRHIPGFQTEWTVRTGVEELYESYVAAWPDGGDVRRVRPAQAHPGTARRRPA